MTDSPISYYRTGDPFLTHAAFKGCQARCEHCGKTKPQSGIVFGRPGNDLFQTPAHYCRPCAATLNVKEYIV